MEMFGLFEVIVIDYYYCRDHYHQYSYHQNDDHSSVLRPHYDNIFKDAAIKLIVLRKNMINKSTIYLNTARAKILRIVIIINIIAIIL